MEGLPGSRPAVAERRRRLRDQAVEEQAEEVEGEEEGEEVDGSEAEVDARRVEEEPDLPRRCRRLARTARRQVHRDRRALQPATAPSLIELDEAKIKDWLSKGAQPTDSVKRLLKAKNIEA
jgi:hypothetical protein